MIVHVQIASVQVEAAKLAVHMGTWRPGGGGLGRGERDGCQASHWRHLLLQCCHRLTTSCSSALVTAVHYLSRACLSDGVCQPFTHRPDDELRRGPRSRETVHSLKVALETALEMLEADVPILPNLKQAQADMHVAISSLVAGSDGGLGHELLTSLIACDAVIQNGKVGMVHDIPHVLSAFRRPSVCRVPRVAVWCFLAAFWQCRSL